MFRKFLVEAIHRHLDETLPFILQMNDDLLFSEPLSNGRPLGEIVFHMLRSIEYYVRGITEGVWEPAPYIFDSFTTSESLQKQWQEMYTRAKTRLSLILLSDLSRIITTHSRHATIAELLQEMLEHSIHHRGQLTVYLRLLDVEPTKIEYIV
jgi:uncharacterized damage-inducible protein DinB